MQNFKNRKINTWVNIHTHKRNCEPRFSFRNLQSKKKKCVFIPWTKTLCPCHEQQSLSCDVSTVYWLFSRYPVIKGVFECTVRNTSQYISRNLNATNVSAKLAHWREPTYWQTASLQTRTKPGLKDKPETSWFPVSVSRFSFVKHQLNRLLSQKTALTGIFVNNFGTD